MRQSLPPISPLPAYVLRGLLLCVIGVTVTLGAPILRAAGLFEEHPEHLEGTLACFPQQMTAQSENRRRQPTVLPSAVLRRAQTTGTPAQPAASRGQGHGLQWPPGRAPPDDFPPVRIAA